MSAAVLLDPVAVEQETRTVIAAAVDVWRHTPDAAGREYGDPVVSVVRGLGFWDDVVSIRATLREA